MSAMDRIDAFQRKHGVVGLPIALFYKFFDDMGGYLAALITYYAFLSIFPLLLLLATVLSVVLRGNADLQHRIIQSALSQFPVVGDQLGDPRTLSGGATGVAIGIIGSLYGAMGVGNAVQNAVNTAWAIPRNSRPNPIKLRLRSLLLLVPVGLALIAVTILSAIGVPGTGVWRQLGTYAIVLLAIAINTGIFSVVIRIAMSSHKRASAVWPGALAFAVLWQAIQTLGALYVGHVVKSASATNGVIGFVLGMLAFLYLTAACFVLCVEFNVVRAERMWPRALLTPFTDSVVLTHADRQSYTGMAAMARLKGFERVAVDFDASPKERERDERSGADEEVVDGEGPARAGGSTEGEGRGAE